MNYACNAFYLLVLVLLAPLHLFGDAQESPGGSRELAAREIPVPQGVSDEFKVQLDQRVIPPALPTPRTKEEWITAQQQLDVLQAQEAQQLMAEYNASWESVDIAGVPCFIVTPDKIREQFKGQMLVHLHGGAFVLGGGEGAVREAMWMADATKAKVLSIDYRRPPQHPFPAALEDAVAVWNEITKTQEASETVLFGTSAGGNLTLATTLKLKDTGAKLPGALFVGTPAANLEKTGDTWYTLEGLDPLGKYEGFLKGTFDVYVPSGDFSSPYVSPLHGDFTGFPPTILISGTRDLLLSDTVLVHRAMRAAGVEADLHIYEGQSHGDYVITWPSPEALDAQREVYEFFIKHLNK